MVQLAHGRTHDLDGTLDVVCTRDDLPLPTVYIYDNALSDHRLLCWRSCLQRPLPVYSCSICQVWRSFDQDTFQTNLRASVLCDDQHWISLDGDGLVQLYVYTLETLLNDQIPVRTTTFHCGQSNAWFNEECWKAKKSLRALERAVRRIGQLSDQSQLAVLAWRDERHRYHDPVRRTRSTFRKSRIETERAHPRRLWQSFDKTLGHGRVPPAEIDASTLHQFFDDKVDGVREATFGATLPVFTAVPAYDVRTYH
jgi:hypothetical protein